jgi:Tat protein secretion system quality control protein TatD with DNase activity
MPQLNPSYKSTSIKDLSKETLKIAVTGLIVNKNENTITIDDGTGSIPVLIETDLPMNTFVKIYGILIPAEEGFEMQGHVIQDLSKINQELYKKVKSFLEQS